MKAEIKEPNKTWQPIILELTFETQEEFIAFKSLVARDLFVPRALYEQGYIPGSKRDTLSDCMVKVNKCFSKLEEKM